MCVCMYNYTDASPSHYAIYLYKKYRCSYPNKGIYLGSMPKNCQKRLCLFLRAFLVKDKTSFPSFQLNILGWD